MSPTTPLPSPPADADAIDHDCSMSVATGMSRRRFCNVVGASAGLVMIGLGSACQTPSPLLTVGGNTSGDDNNGDPNGDGNPDLAGETDEPSDMRGSSSKADLSKADLKSSGGTKDQGGSTPEDLTEPVVDNCSGLVDCGAASAIASGSGQRFHGSGYDFYVMRDASGLYSVSSLCTHDYRPINLQATRFYCPYHGATFDLNGQSPTRPAKKVLVHYALCVDGSGNISVDYNTVVPYTTRA